MLSSQRTAHPDIHPSITVYQGSSKQGILRTPEWPSGSVSLGESSHPLGAQRSMGLR
ncbi:hypothetical protein E2C01_088180 [Portunus trituberculatus]|uniref:Uncharacterized protein n=1 Tax=Portunus trituberculatus TaxID=210409 RepID=A0A5B7JL86_PORTR|nr:hypothetical protein [Portunus trituberculatus]